jgi:hypothetical protein
VSVLVVTSSRFFPGSQQSDKWIAMASVRLGDVPQLRHRLESAVTAKGMLRARFQKLSAD